MYEQKKETKRRTSLPIFIDLENNKKILGQVELETIMFRVSIVYLD